MKQVHLLVVEDETPVRLRIASVLRVAGYRVSEAGDGNEALRILHDDPPDLVLLDLLLPGISGFEVCAAVRRSADRDVPVLVLTGHGSAENRRTAFACGANDVITKGISNEGLLEAIARLLPASGEERVP